MAERLASRTLRNSVLVVGARAVAKLAVFVVVALLLRYLAPEQYGRFAAMVVYVTLVGVIADLGMQTVFIRDVSRDRDLFKRYLGTLISARLLLSLGALLVLALVLRILSPALLPYTVAGFVLLLTTSYSSLLRAIFYIRGRLGYEAVAIVIEALIVLALTIVAIHGRAGWDAFLWCYSASYLFTSLFAVGVLFGRWRERVAPRFEMTLLRGLLIAGVPLALGFTITSIYAQVDVVLLQLFKGFQLVGWYSAANRYIDAVAWIPQSAMGAVFPALSMVAAARQPQLAFAYQKSYKMLAVLGVPLAVGIGVLAFPLIRLLAPSGHFDAAVPALQLLAPSVLLLFVNNAFIYTLTAINRQLDFTRLTVATLIVNLVLNLALIPPFSVLGAASASTLTELALFLGGWWLLQRQALQLAPVTSIGRVLISGGLMGVAVYSLKGLPLIALVVIGAALYSVALIGGRALTGEEWSILRSGLSGRP
ncbi:MAG TPA: flippase [Candidatus Dormibacteraeota bacterium]